MRGGLGPPGRRGFPNTASSHCRSRRRCRAASPSTSGGGGASAQRGLQGGPGPGGGGRGRSLASGPGKGRHCGGGGGSGGGGTGKKEPLLPPPPPREVSAGARGCSASGGWRKGADAPGKGPGRWGRGGGKAGEGSGGGGQPNGAEGGGCGGGCPWRPWAKKGGRAMSERNGASSDSNVCTLREFREKVTSYNARLLASHASRKCAVLRYSGSLELTRPVL